VRVLVDLLCGRGRRNPRRDTARKACRRPARGGLLAGRCLLSQAAICGGIGRSGAGLGHTDDLHCMLPYL
jgi:hypothetical protein